MGGAERAEDEDISETPEATDEAVLARERPVGGVESLGGMGTESMMTLDLAK